MKPRRRVIAIRSQAAHFQDREDVFLAVLGVIIFAEIIVQFLMKL